MKLRKCCLLASFVLMAPALAVAVEPSVEQALALTPIQSEVEFEKPTPSEMDSCKIRPETEGGVNAWVVYSGDNHLLRRFVDTNGDNKVDQWCYANDGIEVYRDIDADYNGKADQYRWFGTAGLRWGLDSNEDGTIDEWKWISPEEVTTEVVRALGDRDADRFAALLINETEIKQLGFGPGQASELMEKTTAAKSRFTQAANSMPADKTTKWVDFSAPRPGVVPADGKELTKDIVVYENVIAMTETNGKHGEINIGTIVRVGDAWRLIDAPENQNMGYFFTSRNDQQSLGVRSSSEVGPEIQKYVKQLEIVDAKLARANSAAEITSLNKDRASVLQKLAANSSGEDKDLWLTQLIDSVNAAAQSGNYPNGILELQKLYQQIAKTSRNDELIAQAKFAYMSALYTANLQKPKADYGKLQEQWQKDLELFVGDFPQAPQAADAMLQLAIAEEFSGNFKKANSWYARIARDFSGTELGAKAAGARNRIGSIGKSLSLVGKKLNGQRFDLSSLRGNTTLIHYWATWCEPCKKDMEELRKLQAKYARQKFAIVGVNLDNDVRTAADYVRSNRITWDQLHEDGGLESSLATSMGIFTVPVMILVDQNGAVINNSITLAELESMLKKGIGRRR